jgi:hypothetical protein
MIDRRKVSINFHRICCDDEDVFSINMNKLDEMYSKVLENGADYGFFESKSRELMFKLIDRFELNGKQVFLVGLARENEVWPIWFNREGDIDDISLQEGTVGKIHYALICPEDRLIMNLSVGSVLFLDFIKWVADRNDLSFESIIMNDVLTKVFGWEFISKIQVVVEAPTVNFVDTIMAKESGKKFTLLKDFQGLKIDTSVSMGGAKVSLDTVAVKDFVHQLLKDSYAKKIIISGKNFQEERITELDLTKAKIKHTVDLAVTGNYIKPDEARSAILDAYYANQEYLIGEDND